MEMKIMLLICNNEKKFKEIIDKFSLPFNTVLHGFGTASPSVLDFFGLVPCEKSLLLSIFPEYYQKDIFKYLHDKLKLNMPGNGIGFVMPLSSSSKYVQDVFEVKESKKMKKEFNHHLIVTIVQDGYAENVMNAAKKAGATGGTLIKGRGIKSKNMFKLLSMRVEPEKDIVLIVSNNENKNKIMKSIIDHIGINTDAKGMCYSIPISDVIGINE